MVATFANRGWLLLRTTLLVSHWAARPTAAASNPAPATPLASSLFALPTCQVVFALGGPGAGKGTQCHLLEERLEEEGCGVWKHLSAGDLLREERQAGGELGDLINQRISNGKLVPSSITVRLLENAMKAEYEESKTTNFLIDGFPRGVDNRDAWYEAMEQHQTKFVLNFECPEEVLVQRLLERGQSSGRSDDTIEVIRKRFQTHRKDCIPVLEAFTKAGVAVHDIASDKPVEEVYQTVRAFFK